MRRLFDRTPGYEAATFAEAQALIDDGLDLDFVLDLFAEDAAWLRPLLETATGFREALDAEPPSFYFEASLRSKFLAAGAALVAPEEPAVPAYAPHRAPASPLTMVRSVAAGFTVVGAAAALGVLGLGFVTAGSAVPGDWNYSLKLVQERIQYTFSTGEQRVDVQIRQTEARVYELERQAERGDVSKADIERLLREAEELARIASERELDEVQKARLKSIGEATTAVLNDVRERQATLDPEVETAIERVNDVVATGLGGPSAVTTVEVPPEPPPPAPSPTLTPTPSPTSEPTATPTSEPPATPTPTATETPTETATPTADPTETASPTEEPRPTEQPAEATPVDGGGPVLEEVE